QDPQLVSSMLAAIQDFVRDSFTGAGQQGLDSLRLGELRLWSEPGQFATLVAVIRGNPPEELHERLRIVLARIHAERRQALEGFSGDGAGLSDIEAHLLQLAALEQKAPRRKRGFPWLIALIGLALLVIAGASGWQWWRSERLSQQEQRLWADAVARLRAEPGIVVTEAGRRDGRFFVAGLRDPLAANPRQVLARAGIDASRIDGRWTPFQGLEPQFVLKRIEASLDPPSGVTLAVANGRILATGQAPSA